MAPNSCDWTRSGSRVTLPDQAPGTVGRGTRQRASIALWSEMTMKHLWAAALLLAAAPAAAQTIETGSGGWSNMPEMRQQDGKSIDPDAVAAFAEMVDRGK